VKSRQRLILGESHFSNCNFRRRWLKPILFFRNPNPSFLSLFNIRRIQIKIWIRTRTFVAVTRSVGDCCSGSCYGFERWKQDEKGNGGMWVCSFFDQDVGWERCRGERWWLMLVVDVMFEYERMMKNNDFDSWWWIWEEEDWEELKNHVSFLFHFIFYLFF